MKTLEAIKKSNDLRHSFTKIVGKEKTVVKIRLNDECKNGHQDFSITCDIYEKRNNGQFYDVGGGADHEHILKLFPNLKPFVNLHLCDYLGIPMYAVENGFYHLREGFNNTPATSPKFRAEFCEYYRITPEQFEHLRTCENEKRYALKLQRLGILEQWKKEADAAIKQMEEWTGKQFLVDSVKSQYHGLTPEEIAQEDEREAAGYYTTGQIKQRLEQAQAEFAAKGYAAIEAERDNEIKKAQTEYKAKKAVLDAGLSLDNFIFYNHTNTGTFNWKNYGQKVTKDDFAKFIESIKFNQNLDGINWTLNE